MLNLSFGGVTEALALLQPAQPAFPLLNMPLRLALLPLLAPVFALAACKPPPTDAGLDRAMPESAPTFASDPLPSPETTGALWARAAKSNGQRIIYGVPGQPALMALECGEEASEPTLQITRMSPADEGAGALFALVGNGAIGRIPVDATEVRGRLIWQGKAAAVSPVWDPLAGPRELTATLPGAGMVTLNPSVLPMRLIANCRADQPTPPSSSLPDPSEPLP